MHTGKVGVLRTDRTEKVGAFRAKKTHMYCLNMGVPPGSDLDIYSLSRISQQNQAWNIKGTDIEAALMTKDPKGFIALTANSCKSLLLALGHVKADKKNSYAPMCVFVCPMSHFTIQK